MNGYRYILEPYNGMKTRYTCPACGKREKTFVRYIDTNIGQHVAPNVGRCNRESNCGYHYTPKQYYKEHRGGETPQQSQYPPPKPTPKHQSVTSIPFDLFRQSLQHYETNHLATFLINLFGVEVAQRLIERYFIGTSKHWQGATVFWQLDLNGKIRTGKIMLYSPETGKRNKDVKPPIYWAHKGLMQPNFNLKQCLFGEHLLRNNSKPIAIVESEKTALIASVYLPQFLWLAVGSLTNLTAGKCRVLHGRNVILYPDLNGFEKWSSKAKELSHYVCLTVSDLLERKATEAERKKGLDLADYLIKYDFSDFQKAQPKQPEVEQHPPAPQPFVKVLQIPKVPQVKEQALSGEKSDLPDLIKKEQPETWDKEIKGLVQYFETSTLPPQPVKLNQCTTVTDVQQFISSHLAIVQANNGKRTFLPYLNRLQSLRQYLTTNSN